MKKRKILYVIPFAALVLSGCSFQDGVNWIGKNIYEPVKNWIVDLFNPGKKDDPTPDPKPDPKPDPEERNYSPDEVIAMCDAAGAGVVVPDIVRVEGTVALGSSLGDHGWGGKFITEGEKDLVFESAKGFSSEESLDGATIVLEGYAELFNGTYKVGYLPASASPTGSAFSPTLISVTQPGEKTIEEITTVDVNTLYTISVDDVISKKDVIANLKYTDGSIGQVTPDSIDYDTHAEGKGSVTVYVGQMQKTVEIDVANLPHYTPEEVVALCDQAGEGVVVQGLLRVAGFANNGSSYDEKYGWSGQFVTEGEKKLDFGSVATNKTYQTLDNKFIQVEGYAELYQGVYKVAYLPATASPTGEKYNPVLVSAETKDVTPETVTITSALEVGVDQDLTLKATVGPVGSPQDVEWSIQSGSDYATLSEGVLHGVAAGNVVVRATAVGYQAVYGEATIAVKSDVDPMKVAYEAAAALASGKESTEEYEFSGVVVGKRGTDDYFVQSGSYGMDVYKPNNSDLAVGKVVTVKSTVKNYSSTYETGTISSLTIDGDATSMPNPVIIDSKATQDNTNYNILAEVTGVIASTSENKGNLTMNLTVGEDTIVVYVKSAVRSAAGLAPLATATVGDTVKLENVITGAYNATKQILPCDNSVATVTAPQAADPETVTITSGNQVFVDADLELTATVGPAGAPQDVEWSIQSGADYATLQGSTLHGVAAGEVVVRATAVGFPEVYKEATITVEAEFVNNIQAAYAAAEALANKAESTEVFTWSGVVVAKRGTDDYFVQSGEYGLDLYKPGNADLAVGKFVKVSSKVSKYNGTLEATSATIISMEDAAIPAATVIDSAAKLSATKLNVLAEVEGTAKADVTVDTSKDLTIKLDVNGDEITVFIKKALFSAAGLADLGTIKAGDTVRFGQAVTGAYNANLQILPCEDTILSVTHAPAADPESVTITSGDSVYVGEDLTLAATVSPSNAPQDVEWSIESGADYATLSEGKLHGVAKGEVVVKATAKDHADVSATKTITVSEKTTPPTGDIPVSKTMEEIATANNWADATQYTSFSLDDNITVTAAGGGNTGKYYVNGKNWRIYQTENPTVTIEAASGYTIKTVTITYAVKNSGVMVVGTEQVASGTENTVNAASFAFTVGNTGTATNGQVQVSSISVVYFAA